MALTTPGARHLHITKDHDAGRIRVEQTTFAGSGTVMFDGGVSIPVRELEISEVIVDQPLNELCPDAQ